MRRSAAFAMGTSGRSACRSGLGKGNPTSTRLPATAVSSRLLEVRILLSALVERVRHASRLCQPIFPWTTAFCLPSTTITTTLALDRLVQLVAPPATHSLRASTTALWIPRRRRTIVTASWTAAIAATTPSASQPAARRNAQQLLAARSRLTSIKAAASCQPRTLMTKGARMTSATTCARTRARAGRCTGAGSRGVAPLRTTDRSH